MPSALPPALGPGARNSGSPAVPSHGPAALCAPRPRYGFAAFATFAAAIAFGLLPCAAHAQYQVQLDAPDSLQEFLTRHLDLFRFREREEINADQLNFMVANAARDVAKLAATQGYFSTDTKAEVERSGEQPLVRLTVVAGPRTEVRTVDIDVTGAAAQHSPRQVRRVRRAWSLRVGEPFEQEQWDQSKQAGLTVLRRERYPAARIAESSARIHADRHIAELSVRYDSGPLFTLGEPVITGTSRYPESIVRNVNPIEAGEEYSTERLLEYQRQLLRMPYFSNAVIDIDNAPANAERAPVRIEVTEHPIQRVRAGIGYTTDTGATLDGRYSHNDIFGRAWVLDTQLLIENRRQLASAELAAPPRPGGFVHSVHGSTERLTLEGVELNSRRIGVRRAHTTAHQDTAYTLQYYRDRLQQLSGAPLPADIVVEPGTHQALVLGAERQRRQVDDQIFPRDGRVVTLQAGFALRGLLTDETFVRLYGQVREYIPIGRRDILILRSELGTVISRGSNAEVPASLLFRAGGTDSVRGYGFQSIGIKRGEAIYPARLLATGSAEYQHWWQRNWGGAVFYDVGMAADRWQGKNFYHGLGVGARWRSPVGRVRVDLAYGFQERQLRPHFSLGVAF